MPYHLNVLECLKWKRQPHYKQAHHIWCQWCQWCQWSDMCTGQLVMTFCHVLPYVHDWHMAWWQRRKERKGWKASYVKLTMCYHKLPTTSVILLTLWYLILSLVAKMYAVCSHSPHNDKSPCNGAHVISHMTGNRVHVSPWHQGFKPLGSSLPSLASGTNESPLCCSLSPSPPSPLSSIVITDRSTASALKSISDSPKSIPSDCPVLASLVTTLPQSISKSAFPLSDSNSSEDWVWGWETITSWE